jgi:hypothetical protein
MFNLDDVKELLTQANENTLTVYLNVDKAAQENQSAHPAWEIWLRNALEETGRGLPNDQQADWDAIAAQVRQYADSYTPTSKSLVLFAGAGWNGVRTFELALPFENQMTFGQPQIAPLMWVIDEYEPYLVVLVDQEEARFFTSTLATVGFQGALERSVNVNDWHEKTIMSNPGPGVDHGAVHGGSGRDDFEKRMDAQREHLYRDTAANVEKLMQEQGAERVVFGGAEQAAHAVVNLLPDKLKAAVVGVLPIPLRDSPQRIFEQVLPAAQEFERRKELELVNQVIDFARARGRGALGPSEVRLAMEMQRVELLILSWPTDNEALATDLALRSLTQNSRIELVHGEAGVILDDQGEGVAARLYYAL